MRTKQQQQRQQQPMCSPPVQSVSQSDTRRRTKKNASIVIYQYRQQDAYYFQKPNRVHYVRNTNKTDPPQVLAARLDNGDVGLYRAHPTNILTLIFADFSNQEMFEEVAITLL